jgi:hypothetical protein
LADGKVDQGVFTALDAEALLRRDLTYRGYGGSGKQVGDLIYLSDCGFLYERTDWRPRRGPREILEAIFGWLNEHERAIERALG